MARPNPGQERMRYEVITQPVPNNEDDLLLPIPQALLDQMGWKEGDKGDQQEGKNPDKSEEKKEEKKPDQSKDGKEEAPKPEEKGGSGRVDACAKNSGTIEQPNRT